MESTEMNLCHYGVKGMKWGVRKAQKEYAELDRRKAAYKKAKRAYSKAFNSAQNRNLGTFSPIKKHRDASQKRWEKAIDKADKLNAAKKAYKDQKKNVRQNTTIGQKLGRGIKPTANALKVVGSLIIADQLYLRGAGARAVKSAISKVADQVFDYSLLDAAGNVLKRYN